MKHILIIIALTLAACETTEPEGVGLPPDVGPAVVDVPPTVIETSTPDAPQAETATPFETDGPGAMPFGCREMRERDPEANC